MILTDGAADTMVLLPEHLRLPDLSGVRAVTEREMDDWFERSVQALRWGPDQRNGCHRTNTATMTMWLDQAGRFQSPDEFTPALITSIAAFAQANMFDRAGDQPSSIGGNLGWYRRNKQHRAHGPAQVHHTGFVQWYWQGRSAVDGLGDLLTQAWADQTLTDADAARLQERAAARGDSDADMGITARQWLAHVLTANPSTNLSADARAWAALVAA